MIVSTGHMLRPLLLAGCLAGVPALAADRIDFNRQIRPILSDNCFACHGPDEQQRKAKLRLDGFEGATAKLRRTGHAVVPGKPDESELLRRILTDDPSERMPPSRTQKQVTPQQVELLRQWIREGASFADHWAFVTPKRPKLPPVKRAGWVRNGIDRFILARLEAEGSIPGPEADRVTLIRRLNLDLLGLPPSPAEVDAFVKDAGPDAYEKLVDRLFASPHYGERVAVDWLDAARFADTHGFHIDSGRDMTRWREYVIDAFNTNLPFDQFTIEQLAGDLLPGATLKQKIASGFNRNHMINFEGGAIPEEYHNAYVVDRVNTTGTVWLGLTVACAQCHDHKYDPISQREYYQLYAFFHNVPERGLDGAKGNAAPLLKAPTPDQARELARIEGRIKELEKPISPPPDLDRLIDAWEKSSVANTSNAWSVLEPRSAISRGGAQLLKQTDLSVLAGGSNPATDTYVIQGTTDLGRITGLRLEALPHAGAAGQVLGRSKNGNVVLTNISLKVNGSPVRWLDAVADFSQTGYPVHNAIDGNLRSGWGIHPNVNRPNTVTLTCEPIAIASQANLTVELDFQSEFGQHQLGRFRLAVTNAERPQGKTLIPDAVVRILKTPREQRTAAQITFLRTYYLAEIDPAQAQARTEKSRLLTAKAELEKLVPTAMVMEEMERPRDTFVLLRGEYDKKAEKVRAGLPAFLPPLPQGTPLNRLGLARWLVSPDHPLTSRVIVNRYWQMIFGTGLVKTAEDFGSQGEQPSHPELLDWLAVEFVNPSAAPLGTGASHGWSVRDLLRLLVTSAAYRQSSVVRPEQLSRDRENRLLSRGARYRLQAEFIRDQALAVSGLLNREVGGASVSPYQPAGLWQELSSRGDSKNWTAQFFELSRGKDLYRRTMYTFWKRTSPPPQLVTFDAPDRETCTVRRSRTNTPLQALILMNDPTYVEAARKFAERMLRAPGSTEERIAYAFRLVTARTPTSREVEILREVHAKQLERFRANPEAARQLLTVGEAVRDERLPADEVAAWTLVANVLLNLDEVVTKN